MGKKAHFRARHIHYPSRLVGKPPGLRRSERTDSLPPHLSFPPDTAEIAPHCQGGLSTHAAASPPALLPPSRSSPSTDSPNTHRGDYSWSWFPSIHYIWPPRVTFNSSSAEPARGWIFQGLEEPPLIAASCETSPLVSAVLFQGTKGSGAELCLQPPVFLSHCFSRRPQTCSARCLSSLRQQQKELLLSWHGSPFCNSWAGFHNSAAITGNMLKYYNGPIAIEAILSNSRVGFHESKAIS